MILIQLIIIWWVLLSFCFMSWSFILVVKTGCYCLRLLSIIILVKKYWYAVVLSNKISVRICNCFIFSFNMYSFTSYFKILLSVVKFFGRERTIKMCSVCVFVFVWCKNLYLNSCCCWDVCFNPCEDLLPYLICLSNLFSIFKAAVWLSVFLAVILAFIKREWWKILQQSGKNINVNYNSSKCF